MAELEKELEKGVMSEIRNPQRRFSVDELAPWDQSAIAPNSTVRLVTPIKFDAIMKNETLTTLAL